MAETIWNTSLEVSVQKGDKKMPMGKYGYAKKKKKGRLPYGENHDYSKKAMSCLGKDTPNKGKPSR